MLFYRAHVVTVTKLFGLIVNARNHAHLREALSCTLSVCAANPSMLHVFTALQLDLTTAVSKIITVSPSPPSLYNITSVSHYYCIYPPPPTDLSPHPAGPPHPGLCTGLPALYLCLPAGSRG